MVITNQKQANCPSQAQAMGTCPMGTRVRERGDGILQGALSRSCTAKDHIIFH